MCTILEVSHYFKYVGQGYEFDRKEVLEWLCTDHSISAA